MHELAVKVPDYGQFRLLRPDQTLWGASKTTPNLAQTPRIYEFLRRYPNLLPPPTQSCGRDLSQTPNNTTPIANEILNSPRIQYFWILEQPKFGTCGHLWPRSLNQFPNQIQYQVKIPIQDPCSNKTKKLSSNYQVQIQIKIQVKLQVCAKMAPS